MGIFWLRIALVKIIIASFTRGEGIGLPLGNVTSQLFANIYLNELDQFMKHKLKAKYYLRYCDDFIILSDSDKDFSEMILNIEIFLQTRLHLSLHEKKIVVRKINQGIDFLGYIVFPYHRLVRTKTRQRIFKKFGAKIFGYKEDVISGTTLLTSQQSYLGVLSHANAYRLEKELRNMTLFLEKGGI